MLIGQFGIGFNNNSKVSILYTGTREIIFKKQVIGVTVAVSGGTKYQNTTENEL
jgi:hypothetical protein